MEDVTTFAPTPLVVLSVPVAKVSVWQKMGVHVKVSKSPHVVSHHSVSIFAV